MIKNRYYELVAREKIELHTKYKENKNNTHLTTENKQKLYNYYLCDYCNSEIIVQNKNQFIITFPHTITKKKPLKLALCSKCLNAALKEFE